MSQPRPYHTAVYYFPNYHIDPRNERAHGPGWTEWELVKRAEPRFPGHRQPRVPLWGYEDEADPVVFEKKTAVATAHGVDTFLFDWYWYDDGPFLQRALEEGYLGAADRHGVSFALMWANHNWINIHPALLTYEPPVLYPGAVTAETWEKMTDHIIRRYFLHPDYWQIDGRPYFSIYELMTLMRGLGGLEPTRRALERFRAKTIGAGLPGLHLNAVVWGVQILPGEQAIESPNQLLEALGFDSITSYVWIHHFAPPHFPATDYRLVMEEAERYWRRAREEFTLPYHPNVTMGWDSSPRTCPSEGFINRGYPFMPALVDNPPERFREALERVKAFLDEEPGNPHILTVNAWNEWTEGSYLEPDTVYGMGYLEAIRGVLGGR